MIEKTYQPNDIEPRISAAWEQAQAFRAGRPDRAGAKPYCIVIPPPNVTGSLHMGHALNNTLQDVLCRFERMRGRDVLWQVGTDHAGIATQMVVERQLMERQQPSRRDMGREAFLKRVWEWKAESGGIIINQLKRLGASCDWSRERFTMDEGLSKAVIKVFVELYRQGLIYKDKRLVNWDPKLLTAISDLEVQQVEVKGHLWHLRYPLEGKTFNPEDSSTYIVVATTRPETMLGDVAVAVHPEDERYRDLVANRVHAILPLVGRRIPIIADEYSDPEKGTGAVKITPAHDFNDFEVGKRHGLPQISVLDPEAKLMLKGNEEFLKNARPELILVEVLEGKDRFIARKQIVQQLEERGLLDKIEPHTNMVPHGDRSGVVIEPYLTDQWYVDAKTLAKPALEVVRSGQTTFVPKNWEKTYFEWMENIQPWCISRQLWWGHQIPVWYATKPDNFEKLDALTDWLEATVIGTKGQFAIPQEMQVSLSTITICAESEEEALLLLRKEFPENCEFEFRHDWPVHREDVPSAGLGKLIDGKRTVSVVRDPDVLDTWFSSALWPFSTLGWPDNTSELKRFYPTNVLVTGFDIIFFWVARMMMMGLHFMKEVPFPTVYIHALVRDEKGAKMSKSKGNVIDPLSIIDDLGADALRFTLALMAAQGRDIKLSPARVESERNFATKLWNATRFAEMNGCARIENFDPKSAKEVLNRWIAHETARAARDVTAELEAYKFNEAAGTVRAFVWNVFCDWYLELVKPVLTGPDGPAKTETQAMVAWARDEILKILHPFMPFITEELWAVTAGETPRKEILALAAWPDLTGLEDDKAEAEIGWVVDLVTAIRSVRAEMNVVPATMVPLVLANASDETIARAERWLEFLKRLARVSDISSADTVPQGSLQLVIRGKVVALPLKGVIDLAAERARLEKEMSKVDADIKRVDAKLSNADFVKRAPEEIIDGEREKREEAEGRRTKILEALERLKGAA